MRNLGFLFLFLLLIASAVSVKSQTSDAGEKKRLLAYITPARDSASQAFTNYKNVSKGKLPGPNVDSLRSVYQALATNLRQREKEFIQQNSSSYAALEYFNIYILNSINYRQDSVIAIFSFFSDDLKATALGKSISDGIDKRKLFSLNNDMPDFSFMTSSGERLSLSAMRHQKYVLLCFWDSYCTPCIRSIPVLKKIAAAYNQGLQLIHVSIDKEEGKWLSALKKHPMPWPQTCDIAPYITGSTVKSLYDIQYIPQYFLLDKEGKLIYHNVLTEDNDDYTKLQSVLKKELTK